MMRLFLVIFFIFSSFAIDTFAFHDNVARIDLVKKGQTQKACEIIAKDEWEDFFSRCVAAPRKARKYFRHCLAQEKKRSKVRWACSTLLKVFPDAKDKERASR